MAILEAEITHAGTAHIDATPFDARWALLIEASERLAAARSLEQVVEAIGA